MLWWSRRMKPPSIGPGVGVTQSQRKAKAPRKGHSDKDAIAPRCHSTLAPAKEDPPKSHPRLLQHSAHLGKMPGMAASGMATAASPGTHLQAGFVQGLPGCWEVLCTGL